MRKGIPDQIIAFLGADTLPGPEKAAAMSAFREQLQDRLKELLGPTAFGEFMRHPAGDWVKQIYVSRANPPPSTAKSQ